MNEKELRAVVSKLILEFVNDKENKLERPLKVEVIMCYHRYLLVIKEVSVSSLLVSLFALHFILFVCVGMHDALFVDDISRPEKHIYESS